MRNLGLVWILYGIVRLVAAALTFVYSGTLTLMFGALLNRVPDPFTLMDMFHIFLLLAIIMGVIAGIVSMIAGLALMSSGASAGSSARTLGLVAAVLALISDPIGVALGAYTLVVLVPASARNS